LSSAARASRACASTIAGGAGRPKLLVHRLNRREQLIKEVELRSSPDEGSAPCRSGKSVERNTVDSIASKYGDQLTCARLSPRQGLERPCGRSRSSTVVVGPGGAGRAFRVPPQGGWADQKAIREIMIFLHSHGVSTSRAVRIFKTYLRSSARLSFVHHRRSIAASISS
jgi:hypothetical protein